MDKDLNVEVRFEKENINTLSGDGELMLTVLSSFAQEESKNVSDNHKWRASKKFEQGSGHITFCLIFKVSSGAISLICIFKHSYYDMLFSAAYFQCISIVLYTLIYSVDFIRNYA